jgi:structure-specific recognition protein 1
VAETAIGFKSRDGATVRIIKPPQVAAATFYASPPSRDPATGAAVAVGELVLSLTDSTTFTIESLRTSDLPRLRAALSSCSPVPLETASRDVSGFNWGELSADEHTLTFSVGDRPAFAVPFAAIAASNLSKRSLALTMHDTPIEGIPDLLTDARFFIPDEAKAAKLQEAVVEKADLSSSAEAIARFPNIQCTVPRGRFQVDLFTKFAQFRGSSRDVKVHYSSVVRTYILDRRESYDDDAARLRGGMFYYVIALSPAVRLGSTEHAYIVIDFKGAADSQLSKEGNLAIPESMPELAAKADRLRTDPAHLAFAELFRSVSHARLLASKPPSEGGFVNDQNLPYVSCILKGGGAGQLYPLHKTLIFVPKNVEVIRVADITRVVFVRHDSTRLFDFTIHLPSKRVAFSAVNKDQLAPLHRYFADRHVKLTAEDLRGREGDYDAVMAGGAGNDTGFTIEADEAEMDGSSEDFDINDAEAALSDGEFSEDVDFAPAAGDKRRKPAED